MDTKIDMGNYIHRGSIRMADAGGEKNWVSYLNTSCGHTIVDRGGVTLSPKQRWLALHLLLYFHQHLLEVNHPSYMYPAWASWKERFVCSFLNLFFQTSVHVQSDHWQIDGPDGAKMRAFRGIPYAAPPVGNLRWRPPQVTFRRVSQSTYVLSLEKNCNPITCYKS